MAKKINSAKMKSGTEKSQDESFQTIGDYLWQTNENWFDHMVKTGQLFTIDIYDFTRLMDKNNQLSFFEKVDQLSVLELVMDHGHDGVVVKNWIDRYVNYRLLLKMSNNQLTYHSTTKEQVVLYNYLTTLGIINLDNVIHDSNKKSKLLSFLLNRDSENLRRDLRYSNIKDTESKYYTEVTLEKLHELANEIGLDSLKDKIEKDLKRVQKK